MNHPTNNVRVLNGTKSTDCNQCKSSTGWTSQSPFLTSETRGTLCCLFHSLQCTLYCRHFSATNPTVVDYFCCRFVSFFYVVATPQCRRRNCVFRLLVHAFVHSFVHLFVQTDLVTVMSHERLEQAWWNWQGIFTSPYWWPDWILEVKDQGHSRPSMWRGIYVNPKVSKFIL